MNVGVIALVITPTKCLYAGVTVSTCNKCTKRDCIQ